MAQGCRPGWIEKANLTASRREGDFMREECMLRIITYEEVHARKIHAYKMHVHDEFMLMNAYL